MDINVVMVKTVVMPKYTRAGAAFRLSQKLTQEMTTMRPVV